MLCVDLGGRRIIKKEIKKQDGDRWDSRETKVEAGVAKVGVLEGGTDSAEHDRDDDC